MVARLPDVVQVVEYRYLCCGVPFGRAHSYSVVGLSLLWMAWLLVYVVPGLCSPRASAELSQGFRCRSCTLGPLFSSVQKMLVSHMSEPPYPTNPDSSHLP